MILGLAASSLGTFVPLAERPALLLPLVAHLVVVAVGVLSALDVDAADVGVTLKAAAADALRPVVVHLAVSARTTPRGEAGIDTLLVHAGLVQGAVGVFLAFVYRNLCH